MMLRAYLTQWDNVTIVVYYCHFFDTVVLLHNQFIKTNHHLFKVLCDQQKPRTILDEIVRQTNNDKSYFRIDLLVQNLRICFEEKNIVIRNFHEDSKDEKLVEKFFCHALPDATHTSNAICFEEQKTPRTHMASIDLDYRYLVSGAMQAGLVVLGRLSVDPFEATQNHQEITLNLTSSNFQRICPKPNVLDRVWNITVTTERFFCPETVNDKDHQAEMRADFDVASSTSLCKLDIQSTLKEVTWQDIFKFL